MLSFGGGYEKPEFCKPREKILWKNVIGTSLTENYSENVTSNLILVIKKMGLRNICEETCLPSADNELLVNLTIKALKDSSCDLPRSKYRPHVKPYWNKGLTCFEKRCETLLAQVNRNWEAS